MTLAEYLDIGIRFRYALVLGAFVSFAACMLIMPMAIRRLIGAGIVGKDRHKEGAPDIAEMGGIGVFIAVNVGVFFTLGFGELPADDEALILAGLVVTAGACITGILDDLVDLRQRFKAFIPLAFALPLTLYAPSPAVSFPIIGEVSFGLVYSLVLIPVGIAFASNAFNMLEGFNGLGTGLGIVLAVSISILAIWGGNITGLALTLPLLGALAAFMFFNFPPARVFPGDTMTLLVGCALATSAILSKVEFWAALLFIPHLIEFFLKLKGRFRTQSFASHLEDGRLVYEGPIRSLTHVVMKIARPSERALVIIFWGAEATFAAAVLMCYRLTQGLG